MPRLTRLDSPSVLHLVIIRGMERRRISRRDIIYLKRRSKIPVAARSLLCYRPVYKLGHTATDLAKRLGLTQPVVSYAVSRGEQIAKKWNCRLIK